MTIRNLEPVFHPASIAVIGASQRPGSVGKVVIDNILAGGFSGKVWPVNPRHGSVADLFCYARVADLPEAPDLAVIATPAQTVPGLIAELGARGTRAAIVLTAGLTEENGLRQKMLDAARPYLLRIVGPNTLGLLNPRLGLNASFSHVAPASGRLALLSQSGAIATALIDWAADQEIGFSHILSLGDMADVDVGDCLDMLAGDGGTSAILMYLESIPEPRKFLSAARAAARLKPVIAIKSGRHEAAAKAAATHTGALAGADRVVDAALHRAGVLRVRDLGELFLGAETLAHYRALDRARVAIVTNGGGAGVLAVDQLSDAHSEIATLSGQTCARLDAVLPPTWSHANPVDIIGDAPPERYVAAIEAVAADPDVDALLVMNCPTALASPQAAAEAVGGLVDKGLINGKPLLACWLGEHAAREARHGLQRAGIAAFDTPAEAARAIGFLNSWSQAQKALSRVPASSTLDTRNSREVAKDIFRQAAQEGRRMLTEPEAKKVVAAYGIAVPELEVAHTADDVADAALELLGTHRAVVVKLLSRDITHKSDVGGVVLNLRTPDAAETAALDMTARVRREHPDAQVDGFVVQPMISRKGAHELIIGLDSDPIFGPIVLFGAGGTAVEVLADTAVSLPPMDDVLAHDLIARTRIGRLLKGFRDQPPVNDTALVGALNAVSQLSVDFPCITGIDLNPVLADAQGVVVLDARIEIDPVRIDARAPNADLAIRPYPAGWDKHVALRSGEEALLRPIRPEDVTLYPDFLGRTAAEDIRLRFMAPRVHFTDDYLKRLTQLDYDREMAFVALTGSQETLGGVARLAADPDREVAEFGVLVRSDLQGQGLGWALLEHLIAYGRADGLKRIEGLVLKENIRMVAMCREMGFSVLQIPDDRSVYRAVIEL